VLFGVTAHSADPAFGYIVPASGGEAGAVRPVQRFVEKPCTSEAARLLAQGAYWNSGNFLVRSDVLLGLAARHAPEVWAAVSISTQRRTVQDGAWLLAPDSHAAAPPLSLDHAVVAHCKDVVMVPVTYQWRDLGTWPSVDAHLEKDANGNHAESATVQASGNVTILNDNSDVRVIGCRDLMVVVSEGRVLVASKHALQHIDFQAGDQTDPTGSP
jgi:mannose-1-phosphate guanylyltransferase